MSKSKYEIKTTQVLQGILDKDDDGRYFIAVEDKNGINEYLVEDMLNANVGNQICITTES